MKSIIFIEKTTLFYHIKSHIMRQQDRDMLMSSKRQVRNMEENKGVLAHHGRKSWHKINWNIGY